MKVLFDHPNPFLLAHGGFQIQIEQTKKALEEIGVQVDWLRWWDADQTGEIIHYFGRPSAAYINYAHQKGFKVVMSELLTGLGSRSDKQRWAQKLLMTAARALLPASFTAKLSWDAYQLVDSAIALTAWEKNLMVEMFEAPSEKVHVLPNGVEEVFFLKPETRNLKPERNKWLICTATITERKRVMELAEAALLAKVPVWIIGKPYSESDPYYLRFLDLVKKSSNLIRYEGGISIVRASQKSTSQQEASSSSAQWKASASPPWKPPPQGALSCFQIFHGPNQHLARQRRIAQSVPPFYRGNHSNLFMSNPLIAQLHPSP